MMSRNNFKYAIFEGISNIFLHGFMSFAAIGVIAACLLITSSFTLIAININGMIAEVSSQSEIVVYVDESLSRVKALELRDSISAIENISDVQFVTKEQALTDFKNELGDDSIILDGLENENPLRDSYHIKMKDISLHEQTVEQIKKIPGVAKTYSRKDISEKLIKVRNVMNALTITMLAILGAVSIFIISNTVKLATFIRRDEIAIMKMVGATNSFIRWPFIIEGFCLSVIGAVIAFFLEWMLYSLIQDTISKGIGIVSIIPFGSLATGVLSVFILSGAIIGIGGSLLTIRKFLKV